MEALFRPIALRGLEVPNRIVMPPMTTRLADETGAVTPALVAYYAARAEGGAGLIVVEMGSPEPAGRHRARELGLWHDGFLPGLRALTARLHEAGARVAVQVGHAGGHTREDVTGHPPVAPSAIPHVVQEVDTRTILPQALDRDGIRRLVAAFADTAERVRRAGFDAVELHGAHGYLIAQFLSPLDNHRTDEYGGPLERRARFALEVVAACRERVGDFPLIFRYCADEFAPGGFTPEDAVALAPWLVEAGADALHVSGGCYRSLPSGAVMIPPMRYPEGVFLHLARVVKARVSVPVVAVGRLHDPAIAARAVADGHADLVAVGRQLVADPEWPRKAREGRLAEIRPCVSCNTCVDGMREGSRLRCLVNPLAGGETEYPDGPAPRPRRVLVVGGGPAGMEAAAVLAERGHRVRLVERERRLGGRLRLAALAPLFQHVQTNAPVLLRFVDFLERRLGQTGVEVRLGVRATPRLVEGLGAEVVVLATGAPYRRPWRWLVPALLRSPLARLRALESLMDRPAMKRLVTTGLRRPDRALEPRLRRLGVEVHRIGDCETPGRTPEAMASAARLARRL